MSLYAVEEVESRRVKIGFTSHEPKRRVGTLQCGNPRELRLIVACCGSRDDEALLHLELEPFRIRGEWYERTPEVEAVLLRLHGLGPPGASESAVVHFRIPERDLVQLDLEAADRGVTRTALVLALIEEGIQAYHANGPSDS